MLLLTKRQHFPPIYVEIVDVLTNLNVVCGTDGRVTLGLQRLPEAEVMQVGVLVAVHAHQKYVV